MTARDSASSGLILNADDWGGHDWTTDPIEACLRDGLLTSTSGMVLMSDSRRAAERARDAGFDVGLHLNLTQELEAADVPAGVRRRHDRARALLAAGRRPLVRGPLSRAHRRAVDEAVADQVEAFEELYGRPPDRFDGHEHVHVRELVRGGAALRGLGGVGVRAPWRPEAVRRTDWWQGLATRSGAELARAARRTGLRGQAAWRGARLRSHHALPAPMESLPNVLPELGGHLEALERLVQQAGRRPIELVSHPSWPEHAAAMRGATYRELLRRVELLRWTDVLAARRDRETGGASAAGRAAR